MGPDELSAAWDGALDRQQDFDAPSAAEFNIALLKALRPRWGPVVRPDYFMFRLLFTRPGSTGYSFDERVEVEAELDGRISMSLVRCVPRRGESRPAGLVTVAGDYTRPENALPAIEALLLQLADPDAR